MASIGLRALTKRFGPVVAVNDLTLDLGEGEILALLGPSGCGKTTTLRLVAGFETADEGRILLGGRDVTTLPPERRNAGMVFQNYALFPHLTVFRNIAFGLEMRGVPKREIGQRVRAILEKVQLHGLDARYPRQLSGGQQQRTALARALVINPAVLLLDEPLANLDAKLREEMRFYIRSLQREFGITTVYVTHDQSEALALADRVAVMMDGVLEQVGSPTEIYQRPRTARVAGFVGLTNLIPGTIRARDGERASVETIVGPVQTRGATRFQEGDAVYLSVRPEQFALTAQAEGVGGAGDNQFAGVIRERAYLGNLIDYRVGIHDALVLRIQVAAGTGNAPDYSPGTPVTISFAAGAAWLVEDGRGG